jgi:hypothetical protein
METLKTWFGGLGKALWQWTVGTAKDFKHCWSVYPNIIIIMGAVILGLILV